MRKTGCRPFCSATGQSEDLPSLPSTGTAFSATCRCGNRSTSRCYRTAKTPAFGKLRDTPVITVLEEPRLPVVPQGRKAILKGILGGLSGAMIGILAALLSHGLSEARRTKGDEAYEFFQLIEEAKPRFLRRRAR